jgi:hypothetical protein
MKSIEATMSLSRGDRVVVKKLGLGTVNQATFMSVEVDLDLGMRVTVEHANVALVEPRKADVPPRSSDASTAPKTSISERSAGARRAIEALRFGVVPSLEIDVLTVDYDRIADWVRARLPTVSSTACFSLVTGPFGSGKSHAMAVVRHVAQRERYLTAAVEVDGVNVTLAKPDEMLRQMWTGLSVPGKPSSIAEALLRLNLEAAEAGALRPEVGAEIERVADNYSTICTLRRSKEIDAVAYEIDGILSSSGEYTAANVQTIILSRTSLSRWDVVIRPMIGRDTEARPANPDHAPAA